MRKYIAGSIAVVLILTMVCTASALPEILYVFNIKYNTFSTKLDSCNTCHIPDKSQKFSCDEICHNPKKPQKDDNILNPYGMDLKNNLSLGINQALSQIENINSDNDRYSNIDEINNLTFPGDKKDFPTGRKFKAKVPQLLSPIDIIDYSTVDNYFPP